MVPDRPVDCRFSLVGWVGKERPTALVTWIRLIEFLEKRNRGCITCLGHLMNKSPRVAKVNLVFTNITIWFLTDIEVGHVPLVPLAQLSVNLVVKVLGPHDQVLIVCGGLVLGSTLGTADELTEIDHEVPTLIVKSKVMHEAPVRWTVEHLCY